MTTDTERLNWLEAHQESLYRATQTVIVPSTMPGIQYERQEKFMGWSAGSIHAEHATVREAIDAAMKSVITNKEARASMESECVGSETEYFEARPQIDCMDRRRVFEAGFYSAWEKVRRVCEYGKPRTTTEEIIGGYVQQRDGHNSLL